MVEYKDRLAEALRMAGQSTTWLSGQLSISYQGVKKVLDGKSAAFNAENNSKAARALGVDSHWLATGEGRPEPSKGGIAAKLTIRDALKVQGELLSRLKGLQRAQVLSALTYFLEHPHEWNEVANQIESTASEQRLGELGDSKTSVVGRAA